MYSSKYISSRTAIHLHNILSLYCFHCFIKFLLVLVNLSPVNLIFFMSHFSYFYWWFLLFTCSCIYVDSLFNNTIIGITFFLKMLYFLCFYQMICFYILHKNTSQFEPIGTPKMYGTSCILWICIFYFRLSLIAFVRNCYSTSI